ncbi:MAG: hypothetical protein M3Y49_21270 [Actinomycetota bacterium]|nr:hypothetical protein [Actinomycetota bacterium]
MGWDAGLRVLGLVRVWARGVAGAIVWPVRGAALAGELPAATAATITDPVAAPATSTQVTVRARVRAESMRFGVIGVYLSWMSTVLVNSPHSPRVTWAEAHPNF